MVTTEISEQLRNHEVNLGEKTEFLVINFESTKVTLNDS